MSDVNAAVYLQVFPDAACRRELSQLPVHCSYGSCDWKGLLKDYEVSSSFCQISCSYHMPAYCMHGIG